jgi:hypothetical protein
MLPADEVTDTLIWRNLTKETSCAKLQLYAVPKWNSVLNKYIVSNFFAIVFNVFSYLPSLRRDPLHLSPSPEHII